MRKNIINLSTSEWNTVLNALLAMKKSGKYDEFTKRHQDAMMDLTLYPGETGTQRNVAHKGPSLFPWHRQFLLEFEQALGTSIPYWNWEITGNQWQSSAVWQKVGGNGVSSNGYKIGNGPFAGWTSVIYSNGGFASRAGIVRNFAGGTSLTTVPVTNATYDSAQWNEFVDTTKSWRRVAEVAHNNVHNAIRGDMSVGTAANDPIFWFHHANLDRIWYRWQTKHGYNTYLPASGAPSGQNLNDNMRHLLNNKSIASVLDPRPMGISYDTLG